jgi:hypothetical protein
VNNTRTKKVALRNKRHFEEKNGECAACLKYSVLIFVEKNCMCLFIQSDSEGKVNVLGVGSIGICEGKKFT